MHTEGCTSSCAQPLSLGPHSTPTPLPLSGQVMGSTAYARVWEREGPTRHTSVAIVPRPSISSPYCCLAVMWGCSAAPTSTGCAWISPQRRCPSTRAWPSCITLPGGCLCVAPGSCKQLHVPYHHQQQVHAAGLRAGRHDQPGPFQGALSLIGLLRVDCVLTQA